MLQGHFTESPSILNLDITVVIFCENYCIFFSYLNLIFKNIQWLQNNELLNKTKQCDEVKNEIRRNAVDSCTGLVRIKAILLRWKWGSGSVQMFRVRVRFLLFWIWFGLTRFYKRQSWSLFKYKILSLRVRLEYFCFALYLTHAGLLYEVIILATLFPGIKCMWLYVFAWGNVTDQDIVLVTHLSYNKILKILKTVQKYNN